MHVVGTAGHVDHGKSSLVRRLTGMDPDRFEEEKRRGLTIDLGFAWLTLPSGREAGIVDVPGHERFVRNMLAGAGGISVCIFVVAANEGWMPQSAEHLAIINLLGISRGVVALTKIDTVDRATLELATEEVNDHLAGSPLADAVVVPVSAVSGEGLAKLVSCLDDVLAETPPAPDMGRPRLWVDRVFTIAGAGTVVTGTLGGGTFALGDEVEVAPEGRTARIRGIQTHKKEVQVAAPGSRVALNLAGLEREGARRGDAVVASGDYVLSDTVGVELNVVSSQFLSRDAGLTERGSYTFYSGSAESPARIRFRSRKELKVGESDLAHIRLQESFPLARGDRFVLRDAGRALTIAGGRILDPSSDTGLRIDDERASLLAALAAANDGEAALIALVDSCGRIDTRIALQRSGAREVPDGVDSIANYLVSARWKAQAVANLLSLLAEHHRKHPLEQGMPRELLRAELHVDRPSFESLLSGADRVRSDATIVRLDSYVVSLDPAEERERTRVMALLQSSGYAPPIGAALSSNERLMRSLVQQGELVRIGDFHLTAVQAKEARRTVREMIERQGPVSVAQIRDVLGTTRRYAVPLCEWLDATGATRRQGDLRAVGPKE